MADINRARPKRRIGRKILKVFGIFLAGIALLMLIGAVLHATWYKGQLAQIEPYGQLVPVKDGQMHLYSMGQGQETIVLLPGMGVALPSADFGPLMRQLSEQYTVVCVEYFGVGFSSQTAEPRTTANYVEETRTALSQAGFQPPYVLMPHSISGVYSEYYAAKYPQEVAAIICLDGTSTAHYQEMPSIMDWVPKIARSTQATGMTAIIPALTIDEKYLLANGYTRQELDDMLTFNGFSINDTLLAQIANTVEFVKQTMALPYPESVPYFKVISRVTYETPNPQLGITPQEYQHYHLARIGPRAQYEILEGSHFIYVNNAERIAQITGEVLQRAQR